MLFELEVLKRGDEKNFSTFDAATFQRPFVQDAGGIVQEDIWLYNDILSEIAASHPRHFEYIISPTLTRLEGTTCFYNTVCKLICCLELVNKHHGNVCFQSLDYKLTRTLNRYLQQAGLRTRTNNLLLLAYEVLSWLRFGRGLLITTCRRMFSVILSRFFLRIPGNVRYDYAFNTFYDYGYKPGEKHHDKIFEPLLQWLVHNKKRVIVFNRFLEEAKIRQYLIEISRTPSPYENTVHERFLSLKDVIFSAFLGLLKRPKINNRIYFKGYDISHLVRLSIREDLWGLGWLDDRLEYCFARNIFRMFSLERLVYPYENHPWEKCYVLARNQISAPTKLIGFQHTSVSYKLLQHFPGKHEKATGLFPDLVLTVGRILKDVLESKGHYLPDLIREGCALRQAYLFEKKPSLTARQFSRKIAYAFSFDFNNCDTILGFLSEIFSNSDFTVYLKFHPLHTRRPDGVRRLPANFIDAKDIPWEKIFSEIDMLLYDDNTMAIEALWYNVTVVNFALTGEVYDTDRLFKYPGEKFQLDSVGEFKEYLKEYYSRDPFSSFKERESRNKQYVREFFTSITDETLSRFS